MDCQSILAKYSRYLFILFNLLFVITGIIILSVGVTVKAYYNEFETFLDSKFIYASDVLIIIGIIIFLIAFCGCCGAIKENACMTYTFSVFLIIIFILEVLIGIGGVLLKNRTETYLEKALNETMYQYNKNDTEIKKIWDTVQTEFKCCGVKTFNDWNNATGGKLPFSCCDVPPGTMGNMTCNAKSPTLHHEGCLSAFGEYIKGHAVSIESVGLGLAIIQLLGIILSCYISKQIKSGYETV